MRVKIQELWRLKREPWRAMGLTIEAWRVTMEPLRVCISLVAAHLHHIDEEHDQSLIHILREKLEPEQDPLEYDSWIRIRLKCCGSATLSGSPAMSG
jgi:hypothetical protein